MGRLTTHVLDTARGLPAAGLRVELFSLELDRQLVTERVTNSDGRCDAPLLEGARFRNGTYELVFHCGAYFDAIGLDLPHPKFLDHIPIRFGISEDRHYHVPLLLSAHGFSTYRGS